MPKRYLCRFPRLFPFERHPALRLSLFLPSPCLPPRLPRRPSLPASLPKNRRWLSSFPTGPARDGAEAARDACSPFPPSLAHHRPAAFPAARGHGLSLPWSMPPFFVLFPCGTLTPPLCRGYPAGITPVTGQLHARTSSMMDIDRQMAVIKRGVAELIDEKELR